jgi:hypothetical protein
MHHADELLSPNVCKNEKMDNFSGKVSVNLQRGRWKKPDGERFLKALNSRFLCFAPISYISP